MFKQKIEKLHGRFDYFRPEHFLDLYDWPNEIDKVEMVLHLIDNFESIEYQLLLRPQVDIPTTYCEAAKEGLKEMNPDLNYADILVAMLNDEYDSSLLGNVDSHFEELILARLADIMDVSYMSFWSLREYGRKCDEKLAPEFGPILDAIEYRQRIIHFFPDED